MERLRKFVALPARRRALLLRCTALMGAIRLGLWVLPFATVRRVLIRFGRSRVPERAQLPAADILWGVGAAQRIVPRATCLPQALTAKTLLTRHGHSTSLRIGVAKGDDGRLEAHAWVESEGRIVVGHLRDLARFSPLPPLPGESL